MFFSKKSIIKFVFEQLKKKKKKNDDFSYVCFNDLYWSLHILVKSRGHDRTNATDRKNQCNQKHGNTAVNKIKIETIELPEYTSLCIYNANMESLVWCHPSNSFDISSKVLDASSKQKIIVRASTGGGFVSFPWKQKSKTSCRTLCGCFCDPRR